MQKSGIISASQISIREGGSKSQGAGTKKALSSAQAWCTLLSDGIEVILISRSMLHGQHTISGENKKCSSLVLLMYGVFTCRVTIWCNNWGHDRMEQFSKSTSCILWSAARLTFKLNIGELGSQKVKCAIYAALRKRISKEVTISMGLTDCTESRCKACNFVPITNPQMWSQLQGESSNSVCNKTKPGCTARREQEEPLCLIVKGLRVWK